MDKHYSKMTDKICRMADKTYKITEHYSKMHDKILRMAHKIIKQMSTLAK
jgi:hypothetical protein